MLKGPGSAHSQVHIRFLHQKECVYYFGNYMHKPSSFEMVLLMCGMLLLLFVAF